ncbi:MAG TPA: metal-dependent hydrolase [Bryobacteraceae bacterium]
MDPLTHTLTGLALSRAGLKRFSVYATPILLLAANAPDIDIVTLAGGWVHYLHYHRHITHALAAVPVMALLPVLLVRLFARRPFDWKWAYVVSLAGVLTHPLLDWTNAYGIRLLLPFSGHWFRLDIASLRDPWIWAALLLAAVAPLFSKLVNAEIGARPGSGRGIAIAALCFMALYLSGRYLIHERALAVLDARLYDGAAPLHVTAVAGSWNPFGWRGIVETNEFYSIYGLNLLGAFDPARGRVLYKPEVKSREAAAAAAARSTYAFRTFLGFSQLPYWNFAPAGRLPDGIRVEALDLRFGEPLHPRFVARAQVDGNGKVTESGFSYEPPNPTSAP